MMFSTLQLEEMLREKGIDPETLPTREHDEMMKALVCNGGGGSGGGAQSSLVIEINYGGTPENLSWTSPSNVSVPEMIAAIESGRKVLLDYVNGNGYMKHTVCSYGREPGNNYVSARDFVVFNSGNAYFILSQFEDESSFTISHHNLTVSE